MSGRDLIRNCRLVNKTWRDAVDGEHLWRLKLSREGATYPAVPPSDTNYQVIYMKKPYNRNLLKNWDAEGGLTGWEVISNQGNKWTVESSVQAHGSKSLPEAERLKCWKCWATSYDWDAKLQKLDLLKEGLSAEILDQSPKIEVSEWVCNRDDCGSIYELHVSLLNDEKVVREHNFRRERGQWEANEWELVTYTFEDYGPGVRYVIFEHRGKDTQFWAGHYGPKMAAPSVKVMVS